MGSGFRLVCGACSTFSNALPQGQRSRNPSRAMRLPVIAITSSGPRRCYPSAVTVSETRPGRCRPHITYPAGALFLPQGGFWNFRRGAAVVKPVTPHRLSMMSSLESMTASAEVVLLGDIGATNARFAVLADGVVGPITWIEVA